MTSKRAIQKGQNTEKRYQPTINQLLAKRRTTYITTGTHFTKEQQDGLKPYICWLNGRVQFINCYGANLLFFLPATLL